MSVQVLHINPILASKNATKDEGTIKRYAVMTSNQNFQVLSLFGVTPGNNMATTIAEQVMVLFLGTMPSANPVQKQFSCDLRALIPGLPDLGEIGLNCALLYSMLNG
ncbi:hypothetical protein LB504_011300 [Fusarium proliferatum]|nr:hypothetical protein LB504_011300 [Fusarium proliferatum]